MAEDTSMARTAAKTAGNIGKGTIGFLAGAATQIARSKGLLPPAGQKTRVAHQQLAYEEAKKAAQRGDEDRKRELIEDEQNDARHELALENSRLNIKAKQLELGQYTANLAKRTLESNSGAKLKAVAARYAPGVDVSKSRYAVGAMAFDQLTAIYTNYDHYEEMMGKEGLAREVSELMSLGDAVVIDADKDGKPEKITRRGLDGKVRAYNVAFPGDMERIRDDGGRDMVMDIRARELHDMRMASDDPEAQVKAGITNALAQVPGIESTAEAVNRGEIYYESLSQTQKEQALFVKIFPEEAGRLSSGAMSPGDAYNRLNQNKHKLGIVEVGEINKNNFGQTLVRRPTTPAPFGSQLRFRPQGPPEWTTLGSIYEEMKEKTAARMDIMLQEQRTRIKATEDRRLERTRASTKAAQEQSYQSVEDERRRTDRTRVKSEKTVRSTTKYTDALADLERKHNGIGRIAEEMLMQEGIIRRDYHEKPQGRKPTPAELLNRAEKFMSLPKKEQDKIRDKLTDLPPPPPRPEDVDVTLDEARKALGGFR